MQQFMFLFVAVYSFTVGVSAFALSAESFSAVVREAGMSLAISANMIPLGVLLLVYAPITKKIGFAPSLCIFVRSIPGTKQAARSANVTFRQP